MVQATVWAAKSTGSTELGFGNKSSHLANVWVVGNSWDASKDTKQKRKIYFALKILSFSQAKSKQISAGPPDVDLEVPSHPSPSCDCEEEALLSEQLSERKGYPALSVKCCFVSFLKTSKQKHSWC